MVYRLCEETFMPEVLMSRFNHLHHCKIALGSTLVCVSVCISS